MTTKLLKTSHIVYYNIGTLQVDIPVSTDLLDQ